MKKEYLPDYSDGYMDLYRISTDETKSFPEEYLEPVMVTEGSKKIMRIWYHELSIYDRTRYELGQSGMEVTLKVRIPQYRGVDSHCVAIIQGMQHEVYNATHVYDKNGHPETEITFKKPDCDRKMGKEDSDEESGT